MRRAALVLACLALASCSTPEGKARAGRIADTLHAAGQSLQGTEPAAKPGKVCFAKGEQTSGFNKICYYDCLGDVHAINVAGTALCPMNPKL